jgi:hypothetical protein
MGTGYLTVLGIDGDLVDFIILTGLPRKAEVFIDMSVSVLNTWEDVARSQEEETMETTLSYKALINVAPNGVIDSMVNSMRASGFV